jgi:hypothetical protein
MRHDRCVVICTYVPSLMDRTDAAQTSLGYFNGLLTS